MNELVFVFFLIAVPLIDNVSGVQQSDPVIHMHIYYFPDSFPLQLIAKYWLFELSLHWICCGCHLPGFVESPVSVWGFPPAPLWARESPQLMQSNTSGCVFGKCSEIYGNKWLPWCQEAGNCLSSSSASRGAGAGRELASRAGTVHCPSNMDPVSPEFPAALVGVATGRNPVSGSLEGPSRCSPCAGGYVNLSEAGGRAWGPYTVTDPQGRGSGGSFSINRWRKTSRPPETPATLASYEREPVPCVGALILQGASVTRLASPQWIHLSVIWGRQYM